MSSGGYWCCACMGLLVFAFGWLLTAQHEQTALLRTIAEQTKAPVSITVSGFIPEAQAVFNAALRSVRKVGK